MNEMNETNEAFEAAESIKTQVIKFSITEQALALLETTYSIEKLQKIENHLSDKQNYKTVHDAVSYIRKQRGAVESHRKNLKSDALEYGKKVDSAAREIKERLLAVEIPWKGAKAAFDTAVEIEKRKAAAAEEKRVDDINERIANIKALVERSISASTTIIEAAINELNGMSVEWADEFEIKATDVIATTKIKLEELYALKSNAEKAETQRLKQKAADTARQEDEQKQREFEQAKQKAENERMAAELKKQQQELMAAKAEFDAAQAAKEEEARLAAAAEQKVLDEKQAKEDRKKKGHITRQKTIAAQKTLAKNIELATKQISGFFREVESVSDFVQAIVDEKFTFIQWIDPGEEEVKKAFAAQRKKEVAEGMKTS